MNGELLNCFNNLHLGITSAITPNIAIIHNINTAPNLSHVYCDPG
jgi:hypothetical protein